MRRSVTRLHLVFLSFSCLISLAVRTRAQGNEPPRKSFGPEGDTLSPLTLIQAIAMVGVPSFPFTDHLAVDVERHRVFATPHARKSVQVVDLNTGNFLHEIAGLGDPHSVLYRHDLDRIYVSDGEPGLLRIYDGSTYHQLRKVKLPLDADNCGYDPATKLLYVSTSGAPRKLDYSLLNIVDTTTGTLVSNIKISSPIIEQMVMENTGVRIYINVTSANEIAVVDRQQRAVVTTWPISRAKNNFSVALDEVHHRLFVGCRNTGLHGGMSGVVVVVDTQDGREIDTLPIGGWIDNLFFDPATKRLYANCGTGHVYVYQEGESAQFSLVWKAETGLLARTGLLVPELQRFLVSVPHIGSQAGRILAFQVAGLSNASSAAKPGPTSQ